MSDLAAPDVRRLSTASRRCRLGVVVAFLAALAVGAYHDSDDLFPFGPMAQYATSPNLNASVNSAYMLADTTAGTRVRVPLNATGTGVGRAEVEGQLGRIVDEPHLMQQIADAFRDLHPDRPQYVRMYLMRDTTTLRDGKAYGPRITRQLADWQVR